MTSTGITPGPHRPGEEAPGDRLVALHGQQDVDDMATLVDRPVQVSPFPGGLHVRLIDKPPGHQERDGMDGRPPRTPE